MTLRWFYSGVALLNFAAAALTVLLFAVGNDRADLTLAGLNVVCGVIALMFAGLADRTGGGRQ